MKKGTKVFDCRFGHGEINGFKEDDSYPVKVLFDNDINESYTIDGRSLKSGNEFLSLTEYNFFDGGFAAIDSEPPIRIGDMVYCWDDESDAYVLIYGKVSLIKDGIFYVGRFFWDNASKEVPQWFIDANK
jgi:hypothetical protein